jgi:hypothetical protein
LALFLGAGASKPFGYPLTRELMLQILEGVDNGSLLASRARGTGGSDERVNKILHEFLAELLPGERKSRERVPMVTAVLSLLDYALSTGQAILPGRTLDETRRVRQHLEQGILEVIPDWEPFSRDEEALFEVLCGWIRDLVDRRPEGGVGVITTNYDMLTDLAAIRVCAVEGRGNQWSLPDLARKVDFGFRWVRPDTRNEDAFPRPERPQLLLLKLHGSTNWLRCPLCENVYVNPNGPISRIAFQKDGDWSNECHCSKTRLEAQIVSPSFVREMREPNLIAVWKNALDLLRKSDHWVIIGYSFPDEDVGIRALFTRAFGSRERPPQIWVVQRDEGALLNYQSFFPETSLHYLTGGLELLLRRWSEKPPQSPSLKPT